MNNKFSIPIGECAGYKVGDKYYVVLVTDTCEIPRERTSIESKKYLTPFKVIYTSIQSIRLSNDENHVTLHIQWDIPDEYHYEVGANTDTTILLKQTGEVFDKIGLKFSPKKEGAENMFHQAKLKSIKDLSSVANTLTHDIERYSNSVARMKEFLNSINFEIESLKLRNKEVEDDYIEETE